MSDDYEDPLAQDEQPSPMGYPAGPTHHANRIANVPQPPRPALISQTQTTPQAPPAPPEPFTQADLIQMQRLQGALSTINKQVYSAEIEPEDGQDLKAQVHKQLGPLTQRQQATQQAAKQAAMQAQQEQLMHASAQARIIKTLDSQHAAEAFPQTVATFTNPVTGYSAEFLPTHNGGWEEIKYTKETAQDDRMATGSVSTSMPPDYTTKPDNGSTAPPMTAAAPEPEGQQPMTMDQFGAQMKGQTPPMGQAPAPQILNQFGEQQQPGQSSRGERDEWGRPTGAAGQDTFAEMYRRADRAIPRLGPNATPSERLHRQEQVGQLANRQLDRLTAAQENREREKANRSQHERDEQARKSQHERDKEATRLQHELDKAAKAATQKQADEGKERKYWADRYDHYSGLINKENMEVSEADPKKLKYPTGEKPPPGKEYLVNEEARHAEAVRRVKRERDEQHPPEAAKAGVAPKEENPAGLSDEEANRPSHITPDAVHGLMDKITKSLDGVPKDAGNDTPEGQLAGHLKSAQAVLAKAHASNRPLTVGERIKYESLQGKADELTRASGRSAGAIGLQTAASPPVAAPVKQPEPPDANKLSHEDLTMVRNWMVSKGNHNQVNVPALNKALALHDIAMPKDGSKGRDLTAEESKRYHDAQLLASRFYHRAKAGGK